MAETVHVHEHKSGGMGWVAVVAAILVLAAVLWFLFANGAGSADVDGGTTIEIPDEIEVNIQ